jgi:hypothetical protein
MHLAKKYQLPLKDNKRFGKLCVLEALNKITPKEAAELERLDKKRHRLLYQHPSLKKAAILQKQWSVKIKRQIKKLELELKKIAARSKKAA